MLKALLFDLDNTLTSESAFWDAAFETTCHAICEETGVPLTELQSEVLKAAGAIWSTSSVYESCLKLGLGTPSWLFSDFLGVHESITPLASWVGQARNEAWQIALLRVGIPPSLAPELARDFQLQRADHPQPYDDVRPALEALPSQLSLAVLTNGPAELQREKLLFGHLDGYFSTVTISAEIGIGKLDVRFFRRSLEQLKVSEDEAIVVGDSLINDIEGAQHAGLKAIWLNRYGEDAESVRPDATIHSLAELPELIKPLLDEIKVDLH
jgi:putative hydrolase of the HAD superfamily